MAHDVFISYSTKDKPIADAVCATLESTGVRCWVAPRDIQPGADWGEAIVDAIAQSRLFILIFSRHANESPQVKRELQHGFDSGVVVIPFRIEDILPSKSLDYYLGSVHWLDALSTPLESHLQTLAAKTKGLLQGSKREQDPPPLPPVPPHIPHTADPPAPPPIVPPPRKSSPAIWIALAGIAVIGVIAIFLIYRLTNHPGSTPAPAQLAPIAAVPPSDNPTVDPAMVDTWRTRIPTPKGDIALTWSIHSDGSYQSSIAGATNPGSETGTTQFAADHWQLRSSVGRTDQGTYMIQDANNVTITGTLGTSVWTRLSALSTATTIDPAIIGTWQLVVPTAQGNSLWVSTIDYDGRYGLTITTGTSVQSELGHVTFTQSTWTLKADTGRIDGGTYAVQNSNTVTVTGSQGTSIWTRVPPNAG